MGISKRAAILGQLNAFCIVIVTGLNVIDRTRAVTLSPPTVQSGAVAFLFDSVPDQLFTVQRSDSLSAGWMDAAYFRGTGTPIAFSAPATNGARFFRVSARAFQPLELEPATPVLPSGAVSLPDAEVGVAYLEPISPILTGVPPYMLQVSGLPPDGIGLVITNNQSGDASVQIISSGAGLIAGQRRQFAVTVVDGLNATHTRNYDLRIIDPPPQIAVGQLILKAGEAFSTKLTASGGSGALSWSATGALPHGIELSQDGLLSGTPSADAAELNENGRHTIDIEIADTLTDRVTGAPSPRKATNTVQMLVRLSYLLNIKATRPGGPSLRQCILCHGEGFKPDLDATALALIDVLSGSGAECGTDRKYVAPGDASDSLIYEKVIERPLCGERMPFDGPYLVKQQIERLARWIRELTPRDTD